MKPSTKDYVGCATLLLFLCLGSGSWASSQYNLLPDPSDCSAFFLIREDVSIRMHCPSGQHFHVAQRRCDSPSVVRCIDSHQTPRRDSSQCPPPGPGPLVLKPHQQSCSKYQVCDNGRLVDMDCPIGLHFNDVLKVCDTPENARCSLNASKDEILSAVCPPPGEGDLVLLPDPKNCSQYLVCDNGQAMVMPCSPGLHFNPKDKVCDFPSNAGCKESRRVQKVFVKKSFGVCPPPGPGNLVLLSHPDDCSQYLVCDNGMLVARPCPPDQHFNPRLFVCDFPSAAGCEKRRLL